MDLLRKVKGGKGAGEATVDFVSDGYSDGLKAQTRLRNSLLKRPVVSAPPRASLLPSINSDTSSTSRRRREGKQPGIAFSTVATEGQQRLELRLSDGDGWGNEDSGVTPTNRGLGSSQSLRARPTTEERRRAADAFSTFRTEHAQINHQEGAGRVVRGGNLIPLQNIRPLSGQLDVRISRDVTPKLLGSASCDDASSNVSSAVTEDDELWSEVELVDREEEETDASVEEADSLGSPVGLCREDTVVIEGGGVLRTLGPPEEPESDRIQLFSPEDSATVPGNAAHLLTSPSSLPCSTISCSRSPSPNRLLTRLPTSTPRRVAPEPMVDGKESVAVGTQGSQVEKDMFPEEKIDLSTQSLHSPLTLALQPNLEVVDGDANAGELPPIDADARIRVCVRKRPLGKKERKKNDVDVVSVPERTSCHISTAKVAVDMTSFQQSHRFIFDEVLDEHCRKLVARAFYLCTLAFAVPFC